MAREIYSPLRPQWDIDKSDLDSFPLLAEHIGTYGGRSLEDIVIKVDTPLEAIDLPDDIPTSKLVGNFAANRIDSGTFDDSLLNATIARIADIEDWALTSQPENLKGPTFGGLTLTGILNVEKVIGDRFGVLNLQGGRIEFNVDDPSHLTSAYLRVNRGSNSNAPVEFGWNESDDQWQFVDDNGHTRYEVLSSNSELAAGKITSGRLSDDRLNTTIARVANIEDWARTATADTAKNPNFNNVGIGGNLSVQGNLSVTGTTTSTHHIDLNVHATEIVLNSDFPTDTNATENASLRINRGMDPDTSVRWNELSDLWDLTKDGTNYYEILTANSEIPTTKITGNFAADRIDSGTFAVDRIPDIPTTKITGNLAADRIDSGTFAVDRLPDIPSSKVTGNFAADRIDSGSLDSARIPSLAVKANTTRSRVTFYLSEETTGQTSFTNRIDRQFSISISINLGYLRGDDGIPQRFVAASRTLTYNEWTALNVNDTIVTGRNAFGASVELYKASSTGWGFRPSNAPGFTGVGSTFRTRFRAFSPHTNTTDISSLHSNLFDAIPDTEKALYKFTMFYDGYEIMSFNFTSDEFRAWFTQVNPIRNPATDSFDRGMNREFYYPTRTGTMKRLVLWVGRSEIGGQNFLHLRLENFTREDMPQSVFYEIQKTTWST